jgi:ferredoxin--NADP+ reductase
MYEIVEKRILAPDVKLFKVSAPLVAGKAEPGQFIILRLDERGERIPLTIADFDRGGGTITIIFQEVGKSTKKLGIMEKGDMILNFVGPLGCPSEIEKYGTVVCIGGGIGVAPLYPIARALKNAGNKVVSIIGARNKNLLILEEEMREASDELYVTTDDGSHGHHGFVSDILKNLISERRGIDRVFAIGPVIMMKVVSDITKIHGIKTTVSLNPIMIDGTGMCGGCRVSVDNEIKFACVDGPEFDAHQVDFEGLMRRNRRFLKEEEISRKNLK